LSGNRNIVFDGELLVVSTDGLLDRQTGNGILNKAVKGTISDAEASRVMATLWDIIPYEEFITGSSSSTYENRFELLQNLDLSTGSIRLVAHQLVQNIDQAREVFNTYLADGQEGIILKEMTGTWQNKRVKHQIKFKGELECDLEIIGYEEGTGKYIGKLGALICSSRSSDSKPITVSIGSGFNDDHRAEFWSIRDSLIGKIVAVKYNARIKNKQGEESLFLPIFLELREDKNIADSETNIK
jgi:ATP-dependent DNA ligase